jgi:hypothetical protein
MSSIGCLHGKPACADFLSFRPQRPKRRPVRQRKGRRPSPHRDAAGHSLRPVPDAPSAGCESATSVRPAEQRCRNADGTSHAAQPPKRLLIFRNVAHARFVQAVGAETKNSLRRGQQLLWFCGRGRTGGENEHQNQGAYELRHHPVTRAGDLRSSLAIPPGPALWCGRQSAIFTAGLCRNENLGS